jgi:hypothetical protein
MDENKKNWCNVLMNHDHDSSNSKNRGRKSSCVERHDNIDHQVIPLSKEDIITQNQKSQLSKKNKAGNVQRRLEKRSIQPFQIDIDTSYIFGSSSKFEVSIDKVKPPLFETTNQQSLDEKNTKTIYAKLYSKELNDFACVTL